MTNQIQHQLYPVRTAAILTNSYVAGTVVKTNGANQLTVLIAFTIGSLTTGEVKIEFSNDGSTYYQESFSTVSAGVDTVTLESHKMAATGNYRLALPIIDNYVKISAIGNGTLTSSSMAIDVVVGVV